MFDYGVRPDPPRAPSTIAAQRFDLRFVPSDLEQRHSKSRSPVMDKEDDEKLVEKVAREVVDQHGTDALEILRERAEAADICGDALAAETWRDIADAAERMLEQNEHRRSQGQRAKI